MLFSRAHILGEIWGRVYEILPLLVIKKSLFRTDP